MELHHRVELIDTFLEDSPFASSISHFLNFKLLVE